jgi:hypothetical protein
VLSGARWVSLAPGARLAAIRQARGLKVIDLEAKVVVELFDGVAAHAFACRDDALWLVDDGRLSIHALGHALGQPRPSAPSLRLDGDGELAPGLSADVMLWSGRPRLLLHEIAGTIETIALPVLPPSACLTPIDARRLWVAEPGRVRLVTTAGEIERDISCGSDARPQAVAALPGRVLVVWQQPAACQLEVFADDGTRVGQLRIAAPQLLRVCAERRMAIAVGEGLTAIDLRYCRTLAAATPPFAVRDLACASDGSRFILAGDGDDGDLTILDLSYRDLFRMTTAPAPVEPRSAAAAPAIVAPSLPERGRRLPPRPQSQPLARLAGAPVRDDEARPLEMMNPLATRLPLPPPPPRPVAVAVAPEPPPRPLAALPSDEDQALVHWAATITSDGVVTAPPLGRALEQLLAPHALDEIDRRLAALLVAFALEPKLAEPSANLRGAERDHRLLSYCGAVSGRDRLTRVRPGAPLLAGGLVERGDGEALVASHRVMATLLGGPGLDPRLAPAVRLVAAEPHAADGIFDAEVRARQLPLLEASLRAGQHILLAGPLGLGRVRVAAALAARLGYAQLLRAEAALLPATPAALASHLLLLAREATHAHALPVVANVDGWGLDGDRSLALAAALGAVAGPLVVTAARDRVELRAAFAARHTLARPGAEARFAGWQAEAAAQGVALPATVLHALATSFTFTRGRVAAVLALARQLASDGGTPLALGLVERAARALDDADA